MPTIEKQNNEAELPSELMTITALARENIAEILSYLPDDSEQPLFTTAGLRFFHDIDLVFKIKLLDEYRINWKACQDYLGAENLCLPRVAYQHLTNCYDTPGWNSSYSDTTPLVSMSHPYLPACVLTRLPTIEQHLSNLLSTWMTNDLTRQDWQYGMTLACRTGNLGLVQALTVHCNPLKDDLNAVIRYKYLALVKYILDNKEKFDITACDYSFEIVLESGELITFQYMLSTIPNVYQAETGQRALVQAQYMLGKNPNAPLQDIINYLTCRDNVTSHPLTLNCESSAPPKLNTI